MTDKLRAAAQQALKAFEVATTPLAKDRQEVLQAREALRAALAEPDVPATSFGNMKQDEDPVEIGTEWTPCVKRPVTVHVRSQRVGEKHVSTREGITPVKPDDLIMRGVDGEEYPIGRSLFDRTYLVGVGRVKQAALSMHGKSIESAEPVAWLIPGSVTRDADLAAANGTNAVPLYAAPPRREWVGLTDEERRLFSSWLDEKPDAEVFAAIEAALKEKNG